MVGAAVVVVAVVAVVGVVAVVVAVVGVVVAVVATVCVVVGTSSFGNSVSAVPSSFPGPWYAVKLEINGSFEIAAIDCGLVACVQFKNFPPLLYP